MARRPVTVTILPYTRVSCEGMTLLATGAQAMEITLEPKHSPQEELEQEGQRRLTGFDTKLAPA